MKRLQETIEAKPRSDFPRQLVIGQGRRTVDDAATGTPKDRLEFGQHPDAGGGQRSTGGGRR